jgi:hypothetical protein
MRTGRHFLSDGATARLSDIVAGGLGRLLLRKRCDAAYVAPSAEPPSLWAGERDPAAITDPV